MRGERTALYPGKGALRRDQRLLDQSYRALQRTSDWLNDLSTTEIEGSAHDDLGMLIHAVGEAERAVYGRLEGDET